MGNSIDREKVIKGLHCCAHADGTNCVYCPYDITDEDCTALMSMDVLDLLKEQEAEKEALASLASLADHRRERVGKVLYDLCELGYPHNFQHEAKWVVDYLYELTAIIKRAYEVKNNDNT